MNTLKSRQQFFEKTTHSFVNYYVSYAERHENDYDALEQEMNNILAALEAASRWGMHTTLVQAFDGFLEGRGLHGLAESHLKRAEQTARELNDAIALGGS